MTAQKMFIKLVFSVNTLPLEWTSFCILYTSVIPPKTDRGTSKQHHNPLSAPGLKTQSS